MKGKLSIENQENIHHLKHHMQVKKRFIQNISFHNAEISLKHNLDINYNFNKMQVKKLTLSDFE